MATMATNHVTVAMGQVATTSLPRYSHFFFQTTLFLVTMTSPIENSDVGNDIRNDIGNRIGNVIVSDIVNVAVSDIVNDVGFWDHI